MSEILSNVKSLNLIGNTGAASDDDKLMRYINMAHRAIYDRQNREYPGFVQTTQTVNVTNGSGTLSPSPHMILSVVDIAQGGVPLKSTDVETVEASEPLMDAVGDADRFWQEGFTTLKSYPLSTTSLRVRFVPNPATLASDALEAAILIPPVFQDILVWEAGLTVAYDERDKIDGNELQYCETKRDEIWARLSSYLRERVPRERPRTSGGFNAY